MAKKKAAKKAVTAKKKTSAKSTAKKATDDTPAAAPEPSQPAKEKPATPKPVKEGAVQISAQLVKELRDKTGAQMMKCKEALKATDGDVEAAAEYLRKRGIETAGKRAGRAASEGSIGTYIHHGAHLAVMVEINCETDFVARNEEFQAFLKDICMHIAANPPLAISRDEVDPALVAKEREIATEQVPKGKPENIVAKIVDGRLDKFFKEHCLLEQPFVKDDKQTVGELLKGLIAKLGENLVIRRFVRWELGND